MDKCVNLDNTGVYCIDDTESKLTNIKKAWNTKYSNALEGIKETSPREIWKTLIHLLKTSTKENRAWLKDKLYEAKLLQYKPSAPDEWKSSGGEESTWLSNIDIQNVIIQYEKQYPEFDFLGPSPIDFDSKEKEDSKCVWQEICAFNLKSQLAKGKRMFGFIFNTDPHTAGGSHWISMFVNIPKSYIFFFDSTGMAPPSEIKKLIERINKQYTEITGNKITVKINKFQHQKQNTECGMYSLFCIISILKGDLTPDDLMNGTKKITDDEMKKMRKIYFS